MPPSSKDLFSDTTMSFGDHLEALRSHLWKAVAGVFIGCVLCLFIGEKIVAVIRYPLDKALEPHGVKLKDDTGGRNRCRSCGRSSAAKNFPSQLCLNRKALPGPRRHSRSHRQVDG